MTEMQALALAFAFGLAFNWLITRWGKSGYGDGFTALRVVIGVLVTLIISSTVSRSPLPRLSLMWNGELLVLTNAQHAAWLELKFFVAAGIPMFFGSLWRYANTALPTVDDGK